MNADDIIAHTLAGDIHCPLCVVQTMIARRELSPAARDGDAAAAPDQHAGANAIDRDDERSFDSWDIPNIAFASEVQDSDVCGACAELII